MIMEFRDRYRFLSNFYPSPIEVDGTVYPTVEHAFQAYKSDDPKVRQMISKLPLPSDAKKTGRLIKMRPDWDSIKDAHMLRLLAAKFSEPSMKKKLLDTENEELIEGNYWHDNYWGSCNCERCQSKGKNILGKLLMDLRKSLRVKETNYEGSVHGS